MTSYDVYPREELAEKAEFPGRIRVNSRSTYTFPSTSPSPTKENCHPYGVITTSTGLLTRSNSVTSSPFTHSYAPLTSPSAPIRTSRPKTHRYSRSLSSADDIFTAPPPLPSPPPRSPSSRSRSMSRGDDNSHFPELDMPSSDSESWLKSKMRASETLPSLFTPKSTAPTATPDTYEATAKVLGLPQNPKYWSPTNLSLYIGTVLSAKRGGPLPDNVLRDVQIYFIREKVSGRQFMRFSEDDMDE